MTHIEDTNRRSRDDKGWWNTVFHPATVLAITAGDNVSLRGEMKHKILWISRSDVAWLRQSLPLMFSWDIHDMAK